MSRLRRFGKWCEIKLRAPYRWPRLVLLVFAAAVSLAAETPSIVTAGEWGRFTSGCLVGLAVTVSVLVWRRCRELEHRAAALTIEAASVAVGSAIIASGGDLPPGMAAVVTEIAQRDRGLAARLGRPAAGGATPQRR